MSDLRTQNKTKQKPNGNSTIFFLTTTQLGKVTVGKICHRPATSKAEVPSTLSPSESDQ